MENNNQRSNMTSRIFYIIFIILIVGSVGVTYWKIVIQKDYIIVAEVSCDQTIEICFHYEPESCAMDDYDCLSLPPEEAYDYKLISKKASAIYACEQTEAMADCGEELSCLVDEADCDYTFCDPQSDEDCTEIPTE